MNKIEINNSTIFSDKNVVKPIYEETELYSFNNYDESYAVTLDTYGEEYAPGRTPVYPYDYPMMPTTAVIKSLKITVPIEYIEDAIDEGFISLMIESKYMPSPQSDDEQASTGKYVNLLGEIMALNDFVYEFGMSMEIKDNSIIINDFNNFMSMLDDIKAFVPEFHLGFQFTQYVGWNEEYQYDEYAPCDVDVTLGGFSCINEEDVTKVDQTYTLQKNGQHSIKYYFEDDNIRTLTTASFSEALYDDTDPIVEVTIPNAIESIGNYTFANFLNLRKVNFNEGLKYIGEESFYGDKLEVIELPDSLTEIGYNAFCSCSRVNKLKIGKNLTIDNIGEDAFYGVKLAPDQFECNGSISLDDLVDNCGVTKLTEYINGLQIVDTTVVGYVGKHSTVEIPNYITTIASYAFRFNQDIKHIVFGKNLETIQYSAFDNCYNLEKINFTGNSLKRIESNAFNACHIKDIKLPEGVEYIGDNAFASYQGEYITIPSTVTTIGRTAFKLCECNTLVWKAINCTTYPTSTSSVPFYNGNIKNLVIDNGVKTIPNYFLAYAKSLNTIVIPQSVESIGTYAFFEVNALKYLKILSNSLKSIGNNAFNDCYYLNRIDIVTKTAPTIGNNTFAYVASNGTLNYPKGSDYSVWLGTTANYLGYRGWKDKWEEPAVRIGDFMVKKGVAIEYLGAGGVVDIPAGITKIGDNLFKDNKAVTGFTASSDLVEIGTYAFNGTGIGTITIPDSVKILGDYSFGNLGGGWCTAFNSGNGVEVIGTGVISGNDRYNGTTIVLGPNVKTIKSSAFSGINKINGITSYATTAPVWEGSIGTGFRTWAGISYPAGSDYSTWKSKIGTNNIAWSEF